MPKNNLFGKALSLGISILMISLLFFDLIPISSAVFVSPGTIDDASVNIGTTITFNDVNLTIRGPERIPVSFLNFTIFDGNTEIAHVKFNIDGTVIEQYPSGKFTVTSLTDISSIPHGSGGSYYGYDEMDGTNHSFGYGYGYGSAGYSDIYVLYRITYSTHATGTFYAKLFVNSVSHTYVSGASIAFTVSSEPPVHPEIYVDNNNTEGPWDGTSEHPYRSIQAGIDAVSIGGTVIVNNGTYNENLVIAKSVNVIGEGAETTIVRNNNSDHVFYVTADNVNISGFTVEEADFFETVGIYLSGAEYCNISNNNISNNYYGIRLKSSSDNNILTNNYVSSNAEYGIYLTDSSNNTLANNIASNNTNGIYLKDSSNNILTNSYVFSNTKYGIHLLDSSTNTLADNIATSNSNAGIHLGGSSDNTLTDNVASNNTNGIYLEGSSDNTLANNIASNNTNGIYLEGSSDNTLTDNVASNNTNGIHLFGSSTNNLANSTVTSNSNAGINLRSSSGNTLASNTVLNNAYGIYSSSSKNNLIYNNYLQNTNNAWDDGNNRWNTSKTYGTNIVGNPYLGGNYWHDYNGKDTDGDALGDTLTPYTCSGNIINGGDYHPLTKTNINSPPNKPVRPSGPTHGKKGRYYEYSSLATDPDGDRLYYLWDWGDGLSDWLGPYDSGELCRISYSWAFKGAYEVKVKVKDVYGEESEWSDPLPVSMPKNKLSSIDSLFLQLLERFLERFPLLERIIHFLQSLFNSILSRLCD